MGSNFVLCLYLGNWRNGSGSILKCYVTYVPVEYRCLGSFQEEFNRSGIHKSGCDIEDMSLQGNNMIQSRIQFLHLGLPHTVVGGRNQLILATKTSTKLLLEKSPFVFYAT